MLQLDEERGLPEQKLPFAPAPPRVHESSFAVADRLFAWTQRWRLPLTLLFGLLIAAAAFFAYESSEDNPLATNPSTTIEAARSDALTAAVSDMASGDGSDGVSADDGSSNGDDRDPAGWTSTAAGIAADTGAATDKRAGDEEDLITSSSGRTSTSRTATLARAATTAASTGSKPTTSAPKAALPTTAPTTLSGRPSSTAPATTRALTTATTTPPTTQAPTQPPIASLGDRVTLDSPNGSGYSKMTVRLRYDANRDGVGESVAQQTTTDGSGYYGFKAAPGCYVVEFAIPDGVRVVQGSNRQQVCTAGENNARLDLAVGIIPQVAAPPACEVQLGNNRYAGVEIQDPNRNWAPSYVFYDSRNNVVLRTSQLGPPDDTTNPNRNTIEWTSQNWGYEESVVVKVAAEDNQGNRSELVTCHRKNV